ncbi:MAG: hypothetical protein LH630_00405 [Actinomycetia bacterium]|nr:hypothetical protein [Actinomycetes bacterium]
MVCTGNICRSPMMERIMRDAVARGGGHMVIHTSSAGTWARNGEPMQPFAAATLTEQHVDASGFRAIRLTEDLVRPCDLVITATREHRSHVVGLVPGVVRRTFTLLELARVATSSSVPARLEAPGTAEHLRASVAWAAQLRGSVSRREESVDDLDDPLGTPLEVYRERAEAITRAVEQIVPFLMGERGATAAG